MSDPGDHQQQPIAHDEANTTSQSLAGEEPGREHGVAEPKQDVSREVTDMSGQESDREDEHSGSRAQEIEREASEHLARRAAGLGIKTDEMSSNSSGKADGGKTELPASPPPPPVPTKDASDPKQSAQTEEYDEKHPVQSEETPMDVPEAPQGATEGMGLEIQNIMDQFQEGNAPGEEEIMSPLLEKQQPIFVLPPRTSSLENRDQHSLSPQTTGGSMQSPSFASPASGKPPSVSGASLSKVKSEDSESIMSAKAGSIFQPPPPSPDPEPTLPFDFHRFLEQLRHRTADPVARFLRSFLNEFGKKQWMVHEQVKLISDFLQFIAKRMAQCEVWRTVSNAEFDNAREGMEKLVMNRLYSQTFSPAIPAVSGSSPRKAGKTGRSQADAATPHGSGRRGQHQEDVERDEVIAQKLRIYGWIQEEHLDIKPITEKGRKFLTLAQQELLKLNTYRAPRDKVICVLNCCKVIFGFLKNSRGDQSADAFVPLLIYTVLRASPEHLASNVQYIWRFRNQDKLGGEAGYYLSSLMGVVSFIENLDRTNLTITDEEFERNVEEAVSAIAQENKAEEYEEKTHTAAAAPAAPLQRLNEKSAPSRPEVTQRNSLDGEQSSPRRSHSREKSQLSAAESSDDFDDAVTGLLRTIQKPLSSIGRIFSDDTTTTQQGSSLRATSTSRKASPAPPDGRRTASPNGAFAAGQPALGQNAAAEAVAKQASVETAQAQKVRVRENRVVAEYVEFLPLGL